MIARHGRRDASQAAPDAPATAGRVLHGAVRYDLLLWLITFGRERRYRERMLRLARLVPGESVLDVGCGTGTLAIAARRLVGSTGAVFGVDASPEMIARAARKAANASVDVTFEHAVAEALPFPDARFDVVLSTVMLHHLPKTARRQCAREIARVLKPGGRVLAVDFGASQKPRGVLAHLHHRHGSIPLADLIALFADVGLMSIGSGDVGLGNLHFVLAAVPDRVRGGAQPPP